MQPDGKMLITIFQAGLKEYPTLVSKPLSQLQYGFSNLELHG